MSFSAGLFSTPPFSPNWNHIPAAGGTLQLTAIEFDQNGAIKSPSWSYSTDDSGVATVSGSGLVTGVASGVCNITASSSDNVSAVFPLGVALLNWITRTIAFGTSTTITANGGGDSTSWNVGTCGCVEAVGPYNVQGIVTGATITLNTGVFSAPIGGPGTAHCPVVCNFQTGQTSVLNSLQGNTNPIWSFPGIYAQSTLTVTGVPAWSGN